MDFVELLKLLLVEENGKTKDEAEHLVAAYPDVVVRGILGGNFMLRATAMALEIVHEKTKKNE